MTSDIHALSGAYAVDALDDIERAQFERHLAECSECRAEVDSLREAAALLPETTAVEPPAALRDRLLAEVATVRPLPPVTPAAPARGTGRRRRLAPLVAAAAVVAALGAGGVVWHPWTDETVQRQPSAIERVLDAPDAERVTQKLGDDVQATLVRSRSRNQAVLLTQNMPAPPDGKVYEMWLQDPDKGMVPAGLMPDGATTVLLSGDAADAIGAGITVEPAGGSHVPTSDPVLLFEFENA
ncbi:anti-sigma factor [Nocardioides sp. MAHUQ-72]|uniref:anti-sigma factor n=1 Tax=unclassified Nocardioides TaxID=2615069 RepID=UPI0036093661